MKHYTGAIFDMDGVLFDTERVYQQTWQEIAEDYGVTLAEGFTEAISGTNGDMMCRVLEKYYHVPDGAVVMDRCKQGVRDKLTRHVPLKPGAAEILEYLRGRGLRIAVASSSTRGQIESNLRLSGLDRFIHAVVSGEEVSTGKPDPAIFLRAAEVLSCAPEQCFVFEDSKSGVRAGHAARCDTIMVPDLIPPSPDIIPLCFRIFDSLIDAMEALSALV